LILEIHFPHGTSTKVVFNSLPKVKSKFNGVYYVKDISVNKFTKNLVECDGKIELGWSYKQIENFNQN
jgi:hypothetical protein